MAPPLPPPPVKPPFTLKELRAVIPPHCFHRSTLRSLAQISQNVIPAILLPYLMINYLGNLPTLTHLIVWPFYWFLQGSIMFGLWAMAHEAGHRSLFDRELPNDTVGFIIHSMLLVPYYNWRISHHLHHLNTGSVDHDTVYAPPSRSKVQASKVVGMLEESPLYNGVTLLLMLTLGFFPGYLVVNLGGPVKYGTSSHFVPWSPIFLPKHRRQIFVGNVGFLLVLGTLVTLSMSWGFGSIFNLYIVPYLVLNTYLITVTYLEHTDTYIPHFREPEWTWIRGALCTVDRSFGPWLDQLFHHTSNAHVVHHLFPSIPSYHGVEATKAVAKVLGPYYLRDDTPIIKALWKAYTNCKFVEDEGTTVYYKRNLKQE